MPESIVEAERVWRRYDGQNGRYLGVSKTAAILNREAVAASSCGRKPAENVQ